MRDERRRIRDWGLEAERQGIAKDAKERKGERNGGSQELAGRCFVVLLQMGTTT